MDDDTAMVVFGGGVIVAAISLIVLLAGWLPAEASARLYNAKFGTSYTTADFFFASDVIQTFHEQVVGERPKEFKVNLAVDTE